jgi:hypothetical protein
LIWPPVGIRKRREPSRQELLQNSVMNPNRLTKTVKFYLSSG